jgi:hypothetical protein
MFILKYFLDLIISESESESESSSNNNEDELCSEYELHQKWVNVQQKKLDRYPSMLYNF